MQSQACPSVIYVATRPFRARFHIRVPRHLHLQALARSLLFAAQFFFQCAMLPSHDLKHDPQHPIQSVRMGERDILPPSIGSFAISGGGSLVRGTGHYCCYSAVGHTILWSHIFTLTAMARV